MVGRARWCRPRFESHGDHRALGGADHFSTFSLDAFGLATRGQMGLAAFYVAASVALSLVALVAGMVLVKGGLP